MSNPLHTTADATQADPGSAGTVVAAEAIDPSTSSVTDPQASQDRLDRIMKMYDKEEESAATEKEAPGEEIQSEEVEAEKTDEKDKPLTRWKELRSKEDKLEKEVLPALEAKEARIRELEEKLASGDITSKENNELKQRLEEQDQRIAYVNLLESDAYRTSIKEPSDAQWAIIDKVSEAFQLDVKEVERAIFEPDLKKQAQMMEDILSEVPASARNRLDKAAERLQELSGEAIRLKENAKEAWHALQERQKQESSQKAVKEKELFGRAFEATKSEMLKKIPGLTADDAAFTEAQAVDRSNIEPDFMAYLLQSGHILPKLTTKIASLEKELKETKAALEKRVVKPGPGKSISPVTPTDDLESSFDRRARFEAAFANGR